MENLKWEYKVAEDPDEDELSDLAEEGWQLVSVEREGFPIRWDNFTFKRPTS